MQKVAYLQETKRLYRFEGLLIYIDRAGSDWVLGRTFSAKVILKKIEKIESFY